MMGLPARLSPLTSIVARRPNGGWLQLGAHQLSVAFRILAGGVLCTSGVLKGVLKFVNPQGFAKGPPNVRTFGLRFLFAFGVKVKTVGAILIEYWCFSA